MRINEVFKATGSLTAGQRKAVNDALREILDNRRSMQFDNDVSSMYMARRNIERELGIQKTTMDIIFRLPAVAESLEQDIVDYSSNEDDDIDDDDIDDDDTITDTTDTTDTTTMITADEVDTELYHINCDIKQLTDEVIVLNHSVETLATIVFAIAIILFVVSASCLVYSSDYAKLFLKFAFLKIVNVASNVVSRIVTYTNAADIVMRAKDVVMPRIRKYLN
jgi:hypothetical protein